MPIQSVRAPGSACWLHLVPPRFRLTAKIFLTYLRAFRCARQRCLPVIGLISSPWPVALAATIRAPRSGWGEVLMFAGLERVSAGGGVRVQRRLARSIARLLRAGAQLFCNLPLTAHALAEEGSLARYREQIRFLPDPLYVSAEQPLVEDWNHRPFDSLLVPSGDDHKRAPLWHLEQADLRPVISRLFLHQAGCSQPSRASDPQPWRAPHYVRSLEFRGDYIATGEPYAQWFSRARTCLLAYRPDFSQGSGHTAFALACGTPLLATRFPYSDYLFERYGPALGEQFDFGDFAGLAAAWRRLCEWDAGKRTAFFAARAAFIAETDYRSVVQQALSILLAERQAPPEDVPAGDNAAKHFARNRDTPTL